MGLVAISVFTADLCTARTASSLFFFCARSDREGRGQRVRARSVLLWQCWGEVDGVDCELSLSKPLPPRPSLLRLLGGVDLRPLPLALQILSTLHSLRLTRLLLTTQHHNVQQRWDEGGVDERGRWRSGGSV